jgi:cell division protein FtsI (penicillin-binding protein 3)
MQNNVSRSLYTNRLNLFYSLVLIIFLVFIVRLFYIQVIQHDRYRKAALSGQYKEYEIPAERGMITAYDGDNIVPIVLNEDKFTLFVDPKFINNKEEVSKKIAEVTGKDSREYQKQMELDTRYSVLEKKLDGTTKQKIESLDLKGVGLRAEPIRAYPQGSLAGQLLGFVNDEGKGTYGIEQALDEKLRGQPGQMKAITDVRGVPLAASGDNVRVEPKNGEKINLTIDIGMQRKVEDYLKKHVPEVRAKSGSVIVMDPYNGSIKAMANYPSYNPAEFNKVKDAALFTNPSVSSPMEVGSVMKTLTVAAGLNEKVISPNTTYYDPAQWKIDNAVVKNVEEDGGAATRSIADILQFSLNTGAVYVLMQLGGGQVNEQARTKWNEYLANHYFFGQKTGIEQGYEAEGFVPNPSEGFGLNIQYANTTFGQGISITPMQFASAFSSTINGGTFYRPHLVESADKKGEILKKDVIRSEVSKQMLKYHENSVAKNYSFLVRNGYRVGGKTGTAEITKPGGGYYEDRFNGTFVGYVGGDRPQYVIMVRIDEPNIAGYAGREAAAPLFGKIINMLINDFSIAPSS